MIILKNMKQERRRNKQLKFEGLNWQIINSDPHILIA